MSAPDLPLDDLEAFLAAELGERVTGTEPLDGALNTMVAVSTASTEDKYVVRKPTEMRKSALFTDLETEYRVLAELADTPVPAPEPVLYCGDDGPLGGPFVVTTYLDGETVPVGERLPERYRTETARERVGESMVDALAELHSVDAARFEDACESATPLEQVEDAANRLDYATSVTGRDVPELWDAIDWLREHAPEPRPRALLHGDYKSGNVFFAGDLPEVTGVFDWETATLGDPLTELGYFLFYWRDDGDPTPAVDALREKYGDTEVVRDLEATTEHGFYRYSNRPGSPTRRDIVERYEAKTGLAFDHDRFYRTHAAVLLATVWEDIHRRQVEAGADTTQEPLLDYTAELVDRLVAGDFPL
ncbi:phosphotransferase family protein [Halobacterium sp. NMX12-1]|uniref:Phosphotransferase family protein n=1 Tax=Halobacterium sp. NMX12-1 TaxID=3166650 RepID=A0AAU8CEE2_9EURY